MTDISHLSTRQGPNAQTGLVKQKAGRPHTGETGWLLAIVAAFLFAHIVAGTICSRVFLNDSTSSPQADASSSYD